ncbi:MAG: vanadium-dependent haloperoxidase [Candidatus Binatia bacterium]
MTSRIGSQSGFRPAIAVAAALVAVAALPVPARATSTTTTTLSEPEISPVRGCGDPSGDGAVLATDALLVLQGAVGSYDGCHAMVCDAVGHMDGVRSTDALAVLRRATEITGASSLRCPSAARLWNEQLLGAIRRDIPRPTVHARNLFHLSVAQWDAWVAYDLDSGADSYLFGEKPPIDPDVYSARSIAISYASYRILSHRFAASPGKLASQAAFDAEMDGLGFDRDFVSTDGNSPAAVGNRIAAAVLAYGLADGSNEAQNYAADNGYLPVNEPLYPALSGAEMVDPNRWQPLSLEFSVTQNGIPLPIKVQSFICPHWAQVEPFALDPVDPGAPPLLGGAGDDEFKAQALEVVRLSSHLTADDSEMIDISPASLGNNPLGTNDGAGYELNPHTGEPYAPHLVKRGDWARVLTEFWADGPSSETPPGHWNVLANEVADTPIFAKRLGAAGPVLDNLEWDVKVYLALNGAVHDAAISAWGLKWQYDSARPISMIRYMAGLGQSTNADGLSYHPGGIPLEDGLVEVITLESVAAGERHEHLAEHVGKIAIRSWRGNPEEPATETAGVGWILGIDWLAYQLKTFVTPAFAGYVSGHSTFSRAAAEVMTAVTGDSYFPGGLLEFHAAAGAYLHTEDGPSTNVTLQSATYQDAADAAGLSRLYGGIHVSADDFTGRALGYQIGLDAAALAEKYWSGTVAQ